VRFGLEGHLRVVFDERAGYFGAPARAIEATLAAYAADARSSWIDLPIPRGDPFSAAGVGTLV
jgi:hypothetical protein